MTLKKLFFKIEREGSKIVRIVFKDMIETKLAFRAIMDLLGETPGISLVREPGYAITLNQEQGAWAAWRSGMRMMISDKFLQTDSVYYIELYNNRLVPAVGMSIVPVRTQEIYLPMVVEK